MNTTKILGEAVGIQSQGIVDKTETQTNEALTSALIIGRFKRGRVDKPMTIHQGNIRGQLGHDPNNIDYIAVQDCLDTGVPSIQVLRVGATSNGSLISCAGATSVMSFSYIAGVWDVYVDDMETPFATGNIGAVLSALSLAYLNRINADYDGVMMLENIDSVPHRLKFVPVSNTSYTPNLDDNPTFVDDGNGSLTFCLAFAPIDQDLYTPAVQALNPIAYYLMDETEGSVLNDSSGSVLNGEIQKTSLINYRGDILRKGSKGGLGFNLSSAVGTAQCYVSDTVAGDIFRKLAGNGKSCTIAFWCKPISEKQYNWLVTYVLNSTMGYNNFRLIAYGNDPLLAHSPESENQTFSENFGQMVGKSNFIVWRKNADESTYSLTVNSVVNTVHGESSPEQVGEGFFFPMSNGYSSYGLRGYMSDMSVFNYALTDAQISDLYQKGRIV